MSDLPAYWPSTETLRFDFPRHSFTTPIDQRIQTIADRIRAASTSLTAVSRTAAWLHGLDTMPPGADAEGWPAEFTLRNHAAERDIDVKARLFQWKIPIAQTTDTPVPGLRVTTLERTLVDCARMLPRLEAVAAADQLLHRGADLETARAIASDEAWREGHQRRVQEVIGLADARSQSPMESWCRCMITDAELPAVQPQVRVDLEGGTIAFLDLGFEQYQVGVEYDGARHHSRSADVLHYRLRRARIARVGWSVSVFRAEAVLGDPAQMLNHLVWELRRRGWDPGAMRLERIRKRINYIAKQRRLERERSFPRRVKDLGG